MEINSKAKESIIKYWDKYIESSREVSDLKGNKYKSSDFDSKRIEAIEHLQKLVQSFLDNKEEFQTFKSTLDGYNKRNNLWGFAAMKGQMFFNQLWNSSEDNNKLKTLISECITKPENIDDACSKIGKLESYVQSLSEKAEDRRKAPKAGSISYFLSYFWQLADYKEYPIIYTSLVNSLIGLELWTDPSNQQEAYRNFYKTMNQVKSILEEHTKETLSHWDIEHCFWLDTTSSSQPSPARPIEKEKEELKEHLVSKSIYDYVPPIIADLVEAGQLKGDTRAVKGVNFEKKVSVLFNILDFEVDQKGQGKGREPDGIITYRKDNTAFIYDAKVRENGYSIGVDDRAIKEYINKHQPRLEDNGYKKVGFIIISSSFKGDPKALIDEITLDTPIKRVALVTCEAMLHLLAHRLKSSISTSEIAKFLLKNGVLDVNDVQEELEDV